ncbi:CoA pyrophosphatase [Pigmentiphaga sp. NML080357]|uniref:CoA pyrophosphatase n=1 Tax=Pigmentiphaga sp. NML080357 TaxID=2008675 RepID=UPI000B4178E6|nr:CoA pyrophosphatase [Pigmentiphaga sp. NML080357]OVZ64293.1 CoA pyrophosphatase [Pigmentiphaga sp. NML080357]
MSSPIPPDNRNVAPAGDIDDTPEEIQPETLAPRPGQPQRRPAFDPVTQPWVANPDGLAPVPAERLTPSALRRRFASPPPWTPDAQDINPARASDLTLRLASVLVPMMLRPDGIHVMLTQRTAHLHDHAGQVSFPGGRVEPSDSSVADAALRETEEETGLPRDLVEIIGQLPDYFTGTGFRVVPLVGLVRPDFSPRPDPFEVAEVFEVPLPFLMDPANHRLHSAALPSGEVRTYYSMPWKQFFIWGATAGMLRNLYQFLRA